MKQLKTHFKGEPTSWLLFHCCLSRWQSVLFSESLFFKKVFIYLFLERGEGKEKRRWPLACAPSRDLAATQACALTRKKSNLTLYGMMLSQLSQTSQGCLFVLFCLFIDLRERERNISLLFHLFMHSLVDSYRCPDWRSNPQPWHIGRML